MDDISKMLSQVGASGSGDPLASLGGISTAPWRESVASTDLLTSCAVPGSARSWTRGSPRTTTRSSIRPPWARRWGRTPSRSSRQGPGIDVGQLLPMLAAFLPQIVDLLTPDGAVPSGGLDRAAGSLPDLGGILGGLLGGR